MKKLYRLFDGVARAWNRYVLSPGLKQSFASCGANVTLGPGVEVAGARNIAMGDNVYLGPRATLLTTRARIKFGNFVMCGPNLTIVTGDHRLDVLDRPMMTLTDKDKLPENDQDVIVGDDVWIGAGVTVLKGVRIANHCVIAAGSVVTRDVYPEYSIWGGVPSRMIGMRPGVLCPEESKG